MANQPARVPLHPLSTRNVLDKSGRQRQSSFPQPFARSRRGKDREPVVIKTTKMKIKQIFLLILVASVAAFGVKAASLSKTVANINADAQKPGGPEAVLKSISASTNVPVATLEKEKARSGLSYGDLFAAHSIAKASGKSFDQIAALKAKGEPWDKIAEENNVSVGGKKDAKKPVAVAKPKASPTPQKSLFQEQRDRYK
jgi:hypothetical protein